MRHTYECQLRWADMDQLGHVNNVTYADYLQEARADLFAMHAPFAGGERLAEGVVVVRHEIDYVAPLVFRDKPVRIDVWVAQVRAASFTLAYEMYDDLADGRRVYLRASTTLAPYVFESQSPRRITSGERAVLERLVEPVAARTPLPREGDVRHLYPLYVRWSDQDAYRHVNNVKYLEYLQESRIQYLFNVRRNVLAPAVVARVDVQYRTPMHFRAAPYEVRTRVSRVGRTSFTLASDIVDGDRLCATGQAVVVCIDPQSSTPTTIPAEMLDILQA